MFLTMRSNLRILCFPSGNRKLWKLLRTARKTIIFWLLHIIPERSDLTPEGLGEEAPGAREAKPIIRLQMSLGVQQPRPGVA